MKYTSLKQRLKMIGAFLLIVFLLPYVVTIFMHGTAQRLTEPSAAENFNVRVSVCREDGTEQISELPWEKYFLGVLAIEVPENSETEFVKAQAVLLRTSLYKELKTQENSVLKERFLSEKELERKCANTTDNAYYEKLCRAMNETAGEVLFYEGTYATVPFHQSSNGATRDYKEVTGQEGCPYVTVRECPSDKEAETEMQVTVWDYQEVQKRCQAFLVAVSEKKSKKTYEFTDFEIISYDTAGYVSELRIGETHISGDQFRDALSLSSSAFSIDDEDGCLRITTMGKGHGLGLSQWTANELAKEGKNYQEILRFFFEGTNLTKAE